MNEQPDRDRLWAWMRFVPVLAVIALGAFLAIGTVSSSRAGEPCRDAAARSGVITDCPAPTTHLPDSSTLDRDVATTSAGTLTSGGTAMLPPTTPVDPAPTAGHTDPESLPDGYGFYQP